MTSSPQRAADTSVDLTMDAGDGDVDGDDDDDDDDEVADSQDEEVGCYPVPSFNACGCC